MLALFSCGDGDGASLCANGHTYDNGCDASCNVCRETRTPAEHIYDNDCDADCNVCNAERTPYMHSYDNACDVSCNVCNMAREVGAHTDKDGDAKCDSCGARVYCPKHIDENRDSECDVCGDGLPLSSAELGTETVESIEISVPPRRTFYYTYEDFDPTGMEVVAKKSDGTTVVIKDYTLDLAKELTEDVTAVHVYYGGRVAAVNITVSPIPLVSVAEAKVAEDGDQLLVYGYVLGESDENEFLIKDTETDIVMRVYGSVYDYAVGDLIKIVVTYTDADEIYLDYSSLNTDKELTVISSGNTVECKFTSVQGVAAWRRMTGVFKTTFIRENTFVKFSGEFYIYKAESGDYVIHMNADAKSLGDIKPDGTRVVRIAAGSRGAEIIEAGEISNEINSFPGKRYTGEIHAIYTGYDSDNFNIIIADSSWVDYASTMTDEHIALREVAYAYYYKGNRIHYDQYGTRRNINPSPELATSDYRIHLDCSSYVNAVYYEAFGENIMPYPTTERAPQTGVLTNYAQEFLGVNPDVVGYWENADYETEEEQKALLAEIKAGLQIGDVLINRRKGGSGHAIIYVGNGYFLHSTGDSYEYSVGNPSEAYDQANEAEKGNGTISLLSVKNVLDDEASGRYLFSSVVEKFAILRPLARGGMTMTKQTEARLTIPGVSIEKTASVSTSSAVCVGSSLMYVITLTNNTDNVVNNVMVKDPLPAGTKYLAGIPGVILDGDNVMWSGSLAAKSTVSLSYMVEITPDALGTVINAEGGTVNGVLVTPLCHTVSKYTKAELEAFGENAREMLEAGIDLNGSDPIKLLNLLYNSQFGADVLAEQKTAIGILDELIDSQNKTVRTDAELYSMLAPNLYGGYDIRSGYKTDNERSRLVCEKNLAVGDVIIAETGDTIDVFVYVGDGELISVSSENGAAELVEIGTNEYKNILVSLISYDRYVILRPSMA